MEEYIVIFLVVAFYVLVFIGLFVPGNMFIDYAIDRKLSGFKTWSVLFIYMWLYCSLVWCLFTWMKHAYGRG